MTITILLMYLRIMINDAFSLFPQEICTILVDTFVNDKSLSTLNIAGMFICLSGLALHVVNKASRQEAPSGDRRNRRHEGGGGGRRAGGGDFSLPLLSDDDSEFSSSDSDDFSLFRHGGGGGGDGAANGVVKKKYREMDDDFFLRPNREWTSTKDEHVKMRERAEDEQGRRRTVPDSIKGLPWNVNFHWTKK